MLGRLTTCAIALWLAVQPGSAERKLVGVWYGGPDAQAPATALSDMDAVRTDLVRIRTAGYNAIATWISWADAEREPGAITIAGTERLIAAAADQGLEVVVRVLSDARPSWGGDTVAAARFFDAVRTRLAGARGVRSIERGTTGGGAEAIEVRPDSSGLARARLGFWTAIARGADVVILRQRGGGIGAGLLALGETAGVVTRNEALFRPLQPRTRGVRQISGGGGPSVDVRLLESREVVMIIALNGAAAPRTVRITFDPDIPEAIWQNLETGATVNFVMTKSGPLLEHTFAASDALVLMTGKKLR